MTDIGTDRLKQALEQARKLGASGAKIRRSSSDRLGCGYEAGRLKHSDAQHHAGYSIEVLVDGRRAETRGNRPEDLEDLVERVVTLARSGSVAHFEAYPEPPGELPEVKTWSDAAAELSREEMIEAGGEMVRRLKEYNPDLYIEGSATRRVGESTLVTTGGTELHTRGTRWSLGAHCQRTEGTDMLFAGFGRSWRDVNELFDAGGIAERILADLRRGETVVPIPSGAMPALLSPEIVRTLFRAVDMGLSGRNVAYGDSPLADRLGEQVLDSSLSYVDDPHRTFAPGTAPTDDDGVPTRKMTLIDQGVLKTFLYDLDSAGLAGAEPTGHDDCAPNNPELLAGTTPSEELLAGIDDGIYVKYLIGFGQGNIVNGDFSCNVGLGYRIRGGQIAGRVKNTMLAGNIYDLLSKDVRVSSDRDPATFMPYLTAPALSVSAAE